MSRNRYSFQTPVKLEYSRQIVKKSLDAAKYKIAQCELRRSMQTEGQT